MSDSDSDNSGPAGPPGLQGHAQPPAPVPQAYPNPLAVNTVDKFDGAQDPNGWLTTIQEAATLYRWDPATCLNVAKLKLRGAAQRWAQSRQFTSWVDFQHQLDHRFGETQETAIARLENCFQRRDESPRAFADRFRQDADRSGRVEDAALVYTCIQRLQPHLRTEVSRKQLKSIDKIVEFCNYWLGVQGKAEHAWEEPRERWADASPPERPPRSSGPPRRPAPVQDRYRSVQPAYRPPFRDVSNRGYRPSQPPPAPKPAPAAAATTPSVEDLTRQLQRLSLNLHQDQQMQQKMQDKDREIRTLRYALEKQQRGGEAQINMLSPCDPSWEQPMASDYGDDQFEGMDIDQDLLASLMVKRAAESDPPLRRMPAKRTAINPDAQSPYAPVRAPPRPPTPYRVPQGTPVSRPTEPYTRVPQRGSPLLLTTQPRQAQVV